jgi:short-subunit dehydrogenase
MHVFITGATSGIGQQLTLDYLKAGHHVIACGRSSAKLEALSQAASAAQLTCLTFDITDASATYRACHHLPHTPDLWILNAGDCEYLEDGYMDVTTFRRIIEINVMGLAHCIEGCQHHFKAGQHVAIVGSIASELALPRAEAYGASKACIGYYARSVSLALERRGIKVSTIYPGFVSTPLTNKNTFAMPMQVSVATASHQIQRGLARGQRHIYFPWLFTTLIRLLGALPYRWQTYLVRKWLMPPTVDS